MKGRILKIKTGYNPNSSGIGVDVVAFFTAGAAVTIIFNTVAAIVSAMKAQRDDASPPGRLERTVRASSPAAKGDVIVRILKFQTPQSLLVKGE
jgi:hypothetical protein